MYGLINRAIESFATETYGEDVWRRVAGAAQPGLRRIEAMLDYPPDLTMRLLDALSRDLDRDLPSLLEDLGTFLVSGQGMVAIRRLLRFGGHGYLDFIHSLEDLPGRARMALPDLNLPGLEVLDEGAGCFRLNCDAGMPGYGAVMVGLLRAMADEYGALVVLDYGGEAPDGRETVWIVLVEQAFAEARAFELVRS